MLAKDGVKGGTVDIFNLFNKLNSKYTLRDLWAFA